MFYFEFSQNFGNSKHKQGMEGIWKIGLRLGFNKSSPFFLIYKINKMIL
jgi:hypothetical protein